MRSYLLGLLWVACIAFSTPAASAAERGTPEQAEAMVKKAVAAIKADGRDKALAAFNDPKGSYVDRDLYVFVLDAKGTTLANGANRKLVGKDVTNLKDPDGKFFIKEIIDVANSKGKGWIEYKWSNLTTQAIERKRTYVEKVDSLYVACGAYQP